MTASRDPDRLIKAFLEEVVDELPDRAYYAVRAATEQTRQRVVIGPWREEQMTRFAIFATAAAVIVLAVVVGLRFLPSNTGLGVGGEPTYSPGPNPTASPSPIPTASHSPAPTVAPSPSPIVDPETGRLEPGTYVAHPFEPPNDRMSFTFIVPSDSWSPVHGSQIGGSEGSGTVGLMRFDESEGLGMGFHLISSLNSDPCNHSGTADDIAIGATVEDLVAALTSSSEYETSNPTDVTIGGYPGKQLVVTIPSLEWGVDGPTECDEQRYYIWTATGGGYFDNAWGPGERWTLWILDVEGQRVVIRLSDFEDSPADLRQELHSIVESLVITAP